MERTEKIEKIQSIEKESEVHELLMELLPTMGYSDVTLTHERGSLPENGKDIVASKFDSEENKKDWYAFVVKKGDIKGTSPGIQEVKAQVEDCFNYSWNSIIKGSDIKINKVKVVTSGKFNSGAIIKILADHFFSNPNLNFWGATELVEHIDKYCKRIWLKGNRIYKQYVELFQEKNRQDDFTKALGLTDVKIKKIVDFAIQPRLIEINISDQGEIRRHGFDTHGVAKIEDCVLIVGESGSGKSTFFKQLARDIIYENSLRKDYEFYPFILKFNDFKECDFDVLKVLEKHLSCDDLKNIEIDIDELIENQNFVLFIDALDELGTQELKIKSLKAITQFRKDFERVRIYCSSRPSDSLLESCQELNFKYLEISNVTHQQAEQFMNKYFNEEQIKCKRLLKSLKDSHILDKLPKTPLTLALIAAIFDDNAYEIPATISDLYKHFVDLLLNKSIKDSTIDLLKIGIHRSVLSYLAEHLHISRKRQIERTELLDLISSFSKERGHKYDVNILLDDLVQDIGLLVENDRGSIEFKHLSFQEYFTAYQFYNHSINGKNLFIENFNDLWWQNVAIFYGGMTKDSPQLIKEILEKAIPTNFQEYLVNLSGLGYLMQALYNTPIDARIEGIKRNLLNADNAASFLVTTTEPEYNFLRKIFNTQFGVLRILAHWFEFHHTSITLREPLEQCFIDLMTRIKNPETNAEDRIVIEYSAYLLAATLSEIDDIDFVNLRELLLYTNPKNYFVLGLINSNFDYHVKQMSKEDKRRKEVKKLKQKLELLDQNKIMDNVNVRLIDGKKIRRPPTR